MPVREERDRVRGRNTARLAVAALDAATLDPASEIAVLRADSRLAGQVLDWRAEVPLADGLGRMRAWMSERLSKGLPVP